MRKYELTYLVSDEVREGDLNKVTGSVNGFVTGLGGKIVKEDIWGRRKLAYPIKKADFATYVTLFFDLPANKAFELDRDIRQTTAIMRHLTIIKEHGHEAITLSASEIAETAEIEEAIGGEKSFEAVEGQTEESFDLMAKRETDSQETRDESQVEAGTPKSPEIPELPNLPETPEKEKIEEEIKAESPEVETPEKPKTARKPKAEKPAEAKPEKVKKADKGEDEAERLSKLNEELDDILKDEL